MSAVLQGIAAFFIAVVVSCAGLTMLVWDSNDGQAGMGAAFGGLYIGCLAGLVTFVVSLRRSSPRRRMKREYEDKLGSVTSVDQNQP